MNKSKLEIKLAFIADLRKVVLGEIIQHSNLNIIRERRDPLYGDFIYFDFVNDFIKFTNLRSAPRAYVVVRDPKYNPPYISNHKSILGEIVALILKNQSNRFETFKIICAGSDSPNIRSIAEYIGKTYGLTEKEEADLKIYIIKIEETWEIGTEIAPRPLSLRNYKIKHMSGAMNPNIAYAMNSLCQLSKAIGYLNIFAGSAALLIEASDLLAKFPEYAGAAFLSAEYQKKYSDFCFNN